MLSEQRHGIVRFIQRSVPAPMPTEVIFPNARGEIRQVEASEVSAIGGAAAAWVLELASKQNGSPESARKSTV